MEGDSNHRRKLGKSGEDIACEFLVRKGHIIIERNLRCGHLEIDIISRDAAGIHFVEVKTRQFGIQAPPQECVDSGKQRRTAQAAAKYLRSRTGKEFAGLECFFDVFAVTVSDNRVITEWFPEAYIPIYK